MNTIVIVLVAVCAILVCAVVFLFIAFFKWRAHCANAILSYNDAFERMDNIVKDFVTIGNTVEKTLGRHNDILAFLRKKTYDALAIGNLVANLCGRLNTDQYLRRMKELDEEFGVKKEET